MSKEESKVLAGGITQQAYYDLLRSRLPEKHQRAGRILNRVNSYYVKTKRDELLAESFSKFVVWITSDQRNELKGKGDAFYITGESGAGKTDIVRQLIKTHPILQPLHTPIGIIDPCVSISLPGPATPKVLALRIVELAGDGADSTKQQSALWAELPQVLKQMGVLFVHIDEFQHLFYKGCDFEALVEFFKAVMNDPHWPVSFIISGMPATRNIIRNDDQAERRNTSFTLPAIDMSSQADLVKHIISKLAEQAEMDVVDLLSSDMPKRIAHAANYQFGRICEVTISAIQEAAMEGDTTLTKKHFARAYVEHSDARGRNDMNPFISEDWARLRPGYFILAPSKPKAHDDDDQYE